MIVIAALIVGTSVVVLSSGSPNGHTSTSGVSSTTSCNQPLYLVRLASQVEQTQSFAQQSHGLSYTLAYGDNESAATGTANGKPIYYPPETSLAFYSYGSASTTAACPSDLGTAGVVGALWIQVPIDTDGSYNLPNMSVYFTPGVFTNSTATNSNSSTKQPGGIVVISAKLVGPYTPAGPTVELTLQNEQGCCVTSLSAILELNNNYTFSFSGVSASNPLDQGQTVSANQTLIGAGFDSSRNYTLVIKGTTQDTVFTDTTQTQIAQNSTAFIYLTASAICTGPGGYAPCWGGDAYVFQCAPNLLSGPSTPEQCTQRVTSTLAPYPSYIISVTLPEVNQTDEPSWANCMWTVQGITPGQGYAQCTAINSTSFIMGVQAPPHLVTPPPSPPAALIGELSAQDVSCSRATGVCTFTIVNNSTDPLELETCGVVVTSTSTVNSSVTVTEYSRVNGTIGGQAAAGIPADSRVAATCTVPASQVAGQTVGSVANGNFMVKLVDSWYNYPAGDEPTFGFQGMWS